MLMQVVISEVWGFQVHIYAISCTLEGIIWKWNNYKSPYCHSVGSLIVNHIVCWLLRDEDRGTNVDSTPHCTSHRSDGVSQHLASGRLASHRIPQWLVFDFLSFFPSPPVCPILPSWQLDTKQLQSDFTRSLQSPQDVTYWLGLVSVPVMHWHTSALLHFSLSRLAFGAGAE